MGDERVTRNQDERATYYFERNQDMSPKMSPTLWHIISNFRHLTYSQCKKDALTLLFLPESRR